MRARCGKLDVLLLRMRRGVIDKRVAADTEHAEVPIVVPVDMLRDCDWLPAKLELVGIELLRDEIVILHGEEPPVCERRGRGVVENLAVEISVDRSHVHRRALKVAARVAGAEEKVPAVREKRGIAMRAVAL